MYQTKIFSGCFNNSGGQAITADDKFNEWVKDNPNIEIIDFVYRHTRYGDHSIAVLYKTRKQENLSREEKLKYCREQLRKMQRKDSE